MVPVGVTDDDVSDLCRLHSGQFDGFVGTQIVLHGELFEMGIAMEAAVEQDGVAAAPNQPDDHGEVDLLVLGAADD